MLQICDVQESVCLKCHWVSVCLQWTKYRKWARQGVVSKHELDSSRWGWGGWRKSSEIIGANRSGGSSALTSPLNCLNTSVGLVSSFLFSFLIAHLTCIGLTELLLCGRGIICSQMSHCPFDPHPLSRSLTWVWVHGLRWCTANRSGRWGRGRGRWRWSPPSWGALSPEPSTGKRRFSWWPWCRCDPGRTKEMVGKINEKGKLLWLHAKCSSSDSAIPGIGESCPRSRVQPVNDFCTGPWNYQKWY